MNTTAYMAKHLREVYFGKNWTWSNLKDSLEGVTWQQATTQIYDLNTIATLTFHLNYYVKGVTKYLQQGGPLETKDKYSFAHPPITSQKDWDGFLETVWTDAEIFAKLIEALPDSKLSEVFVEEKYETYYRNIQGIIEHIHYHLGQIVVIKKILSQMQNT